MFECLCACAECHVLYSLSPGFGVSSVWRHSEPEEPSARLLFVGRLRHRPQQHPWASRLHLFWPMGETPVVDCLFVYIWLIGGDLLLNTFHLYTLLHQIADGQRELIRSHSVKNRHFIGNTSMDAGLSFIMANHAKVKENDLVFDPFVGTGEIILSLTLTHMCICRRSHTWRNLCQ